MRRTRKKSGGLRGGAVEFLDEAIYKITGPDDIQKQVELLGISCHGETTADGKFMMVPPKTYLMFLAHSGEPAEGENPIERVYFGYKNTEKEYYERLYRHIFRPHKEREEPNLKAISKELYIYQPGDIIPDYKLSFNNNDIFMFIHGIYNLPIKQISGTNKEASLYLGRPLLYIRKLYQEGILTLEELDELNQSDRQKVLNASLTNEELEDYRTGIITTHAWSLTKLRNRVEQLCCRRPDNLLTSEKLNQQVLKENVYRVRLSTIFNKLKRDETKQFRFMVMNFCRVSYNDTIRDYVGSKVQFPRLIRSLSFSGKCTTSTKDKAFNIVTILGLFCSLPPKMKLRMLHEPEIRQLIKFLKKILYPVGGTFNKWLTCLEPVYRDLTGSERYDLIQDYVGYLTTDEILDLTRYYDILERLKDNETIPVMKKAYSQLSQPFETLKTQIQIQSGKLKDIIKEKKEKIHYIYEYFKATFEPLIVGDGDFLNLMGTDNSSIYELLKEVISPRAKEEMEKLKEKRLKELKDNDLPIFDDGWLEAKLGGLFGDFAGENEDDDRKFKLTIEPFPDVRVVDDSVPLYFNNNSNNNNSNNNNNNNNNNGNKPKGGRRITRKKKIRHNRNDKKSKRTRRSCRF